MTKYNKTGLQSIINSNFADNNSGDITAQKLRQTSIDITDSVGFTLASEGKTVFIPFGSGIEVVPGALMSASLTEVTHPADSTSGSGVITLNCIITAGNGLDIASNGQITPDLLSSGGLTINSNKIAMDINNLSVDSNAGNLSDSIAISDASSSNDTKKITLSELVTLISALPSASGSLLQSDIDANTANIATNTSNISDRVTNASGLVLRADIDVNTADIAALSFTTLASGLVLRADIDANISSIGSNLSSINTLDTNKFPNASGLVLRTDIDANTTSMAGKLSSASGLVLRADVDANTAGIATNTSDISSLESGKFPNASGLVLRADIDANTVAIATKLPSGSGALLQADIDANTAAISSLEAGSFSTASGNLVDANTASGVSMRTDIDVNTADIAALEASAFTTASGNLINANAATGVLLRADIDVNTAAIATKLPSASGTVLQADIDANTANIATNTSNISGKFPNASGLVLRTDVDASTSAIAGKQASLTFGISNTNAVKIDSASVADDEYARFTAAGLESRSTSEVLSDIGALSSASGNVLRLDVDVNTADIASLESSSFSVASGNLVDANTASGVIFRADIDANTSAIVGKQASLTFGISNTNAVKIDSASVADDEYARFTADGLESRSTSEVLSDIGALSSTSGNVLRADVDANTASIATNTSNISGKFPNASGLVLRIDVDANTAAIASLEAGSFTTASGNLVDANTASGVVFRADIDVNTSAIAGKQASLTFGISNTNAVKIDSASVADDEYARFTANGLESRSTSEVLSDIGAAASSASGTMTKFKIGTEEGGDKVDLFDGSGIHFANGSNITVSLTAGAGSGIVTIAAHSLQAQDAGLTSIAGLTTAADKMIYTTDADTYAVAGLTSAGRSLLDDASVGAMRTTLGLGTAATGDAGISEDNIPRFQAGVVDDDFLRVNGILIEGRSASEVLSDIGGQASLTFGISNTNAVKIDSASVADDEYARFTANGLESRSTSEVLSDIGAVSTASGNVLRVDVDANISAIAGKQASLTFGISNTNAVKIDSASVADDEYARFTANGLESRSTSEVLSDIGAAASSASGTMSKFKIGTAEGGGGVDLYDGSGIHFAAGSNVTIALTDTGDGSGIITIAATDTNTTYTKASFDLDHLFTLVDAAADTSENLGTFTGSTISDSVTIKAALQALETAVETKGVTAGSSSIVTVGTIGAGTWQGTAIATAYIADDAITGAKIALFDDSLAATTTHFLIADGTDYSSFALSGDVTCTNAGVVSIADDVVSSAELADACTAVTSFTAPLIEGSTSVQTPLIEYTDGDNAITIQ